MAREAFKLLRPASFLKIVLLKLKKLNAENGAHG